MNKILGFTGLFLLLTIGIASAFFTLSLLVGLLLFGLKISLIVSAIYIVVKGTQKIISKI